MDMRTAQDANSNVVHLRERDDRLAALGDGPLSTRFCAWRGASGRRYVASIYVVDRSVELFGLPAFESFVLIAVGPGVGGRRILAVTPIERPSDLGAALAAGLAAGATEWHVHLVAADRRARAALVADLRDRHCDDAMIACA